MLVITRKINECIQIGENITVMITAIRHGPRESVRLGFDAPKHIPIVRSEIAHRQLRSNMANYYEMEDERGHKTDQ